MRYLLDTNVLSEPTKPDPHPRVLQKIEQHWEEICTAAPVWNELLYGVRRLPSSKRRRRLEGYVEDILGSSLEILPYDSTAADWHAEERARLGRIGKAPAFIDGQIAAVVRANGLILVTRNLSDFSSFDRLEAEDWAAD